MKNILLRSSARVTLSNVTFIFLSVTAMKHCKLVCCVTIILLYFSHQVTALQARIVVFNVLVPLIKGAQVKIFYT